MDACPSAGVLALPDMALPALAPDTTVTGLPMVAADSSCAATDVEEERHEEIGVFVVHGDKDMATRGAVSTARAVPTTFPRRTASQQAARCIVRRREEPYFPPGAPSSPSSPLRCLVASRPSRPRPPAWPSSPLPPAPPSPPLAAKRSFSSREIFHFCPVWAPSPTTWATPGSSAE